MSRMVRLAWMLLPLVLASCGGGDERIVFPDVLKSDCAPPCWRGVIPGETRRQEVLDLLDEPPDTEPGLPLLAWGIRFIHRGYQYQVSIVFDSEDIVESIELLEPDKRYTFQTAVDEFGPPPTVLMTPCAPDTDKGIIYLVYPEQGMALGSGFVPTIGFPWQRPSADTRVYWWVYFDPIAADLFPPGGGPIYGCGMTYANVTSTWQGFGSD